MAQLKKYNLHRVFTLFLVCFSGYGVHIFDGEGNLWFIVILLLNFKYLKKIPKIYISRLAVITIISFLFFLAKGMTLELWILRAWLIVLVLITIYKDKVSSFVEDFSKLAEWSSYYSLLHIPMYLLFNTHVWDNKHTIFYLFFYNNTDKFLGIPRIQGYAWEPSCWSYILIVNLIFVLFRKEGKKRIVFALLAILFCNSTTVIMSTAVVIAIHLWFSIKKNRWVIPVAMLMGAALFPFVQGKLNDKLNSGSGLARLSDFYILRDVLSTSPILGGDAYHVSTNMQAFRSREQALYDSGLDIREVGYDGYYGEEMVNDLAALLVEWGIILGPFILLLYLRTPFLKEKELRWMFLAGTIAVISGTPITRTSIFFFFPLSALLMKPDQIKTLFLIGNRTKRYQTIK